MGTLIWAFTFLTLLFFCSYALVLLDWTLGIRRLFRQMNDGEERERNGSEREADITIVIPVRNEIGNWYELFEDLRSQEWKGTGWEVLFVDDHSTDGSLEAIQERCRDVDGFQCLRLPEGQKGKKRALEHGIRNASRDWILTMDADCRVGKEFLKELADRLPQSDADLVLLPVLPHRPKAPLQYLIRVEATALLGALLGSAGNGRPLLANGAGMLFKKRTFLEEGGYERHIGIDSGDDLFLLQEWKAKGKRIRALPKKELMVRTRYPKGVKEALDQRLRWASKARAFPMGATIFTMGIVGGMNFLLVLNAIISVLHPPHLFPTLLYWGAKGGMDRIFLISPGRGSEMEVPWNYMLLALFLYPFQVSLLPLIRTFYRPLWKGRQLEER